MISWLSLITKFSIRAGSVRELDQPNKVFSIRNTSRDLGNDWQSLLEVTLHPCTIRLETLLINLIKRWGAGTSLAFTAWSLTICDIRDDRTDSVSPVGGGTGGRIEFLPL